MTIGLACTRRPEPSPSDPAHRELLNNNTMTNKKSTKKNVPKSKAAAKLGRLGGQAVSKKYGKDYMRKLGKKGMDSRWGGKKPKTKKK